MLRNLAHTEGFGPDYAKRVLAKPIVDIAVGLHDDCEFSSARDRLEVAGWIYRGDAGENGGHVFVLETKPQHRVAHLHIVEHDGKQWHDYMRLRDLLRRSSTARDQYEQAKQQLAEDVRGNRVAYTDGKSNIVSLLINEA